MKLPQWPTLVAMAGGSSIGLGCMMLLMNRQRDKAANQAAFLERAIGIMKEQEMVKELLGDEIQVGRATLNDGWGRLERNRVQLKLPVKGERDSAYLYAYARRKDDADKLKLYKLEATFNKIAGKKLVIMDRTNQEEDHDESNNNDKSKNPQSTDSKRPDLNSDEMGPGQKKTKEEMVEEMKKWNWR